MRPSSGKQSKGAIDPRGHYLFRTFFQISATAPLALPPLMPVPLGVKDGGPFHRGGLFIVFRTSHSGDEKRIVLGNIEEGTRADGLANTVAPKMFTLEQCHQRFYPRIPLLFFRPKRLTTGLCNCHPTLAWLGCNSGDDFVNLFERPWPWQLPRPTQPPAHQRYVGHDGSPNFAALSLCFVDSLWA